MTATPTPGAIIASPMAVHPYGVLLDASSDAAALLDTRGGIVFANDSLGALTGKSVAEMQRHPLHRFMVRADQPRFRAFLRDGARKGGARSFAFAGSGGPNKPVSIALATLPLASSSSNGRSKSGPHHTVLMAIIRDLTNANVATAVRGRLLERLIAAEDDERRRVARELHDETGQALTALLVGIRAIADSHDAAATRSIARRLRHVAVRCIDDVRRLAQGLHPAVLDDKGLAPAARRYVGDYVRSFGIRVDFVAGDLDSPPLEPTTAATMYRILQEALTNVARHARAKRVAVELSRRGGSLSLTVRDNGIGFRTRGDAGASGLGLHGMRERVALLGGSITFESRVARRRRRGGTLVTATLPAPRGDRS